MFLRSCLLVSLCALCSASSSFGQNRNSLTEKLKLESLAELSAEAKKFGSPERGAHLFYQASMNCARCHESQNGKRKLGPDLTEKREVELSHLIESILSPSAKIKEGYETMQVLKMDGTTLSGILVEETKKTLVIDTIENATEPLSMALDEVEDYKKSKVSSMPEGLANQLNNRGSFLDLVSYLGEIATGGPIRAAELKPDNIAVLAPLPEYENRVDHAGLIASLGDESLERGKETYRLRCASCHGTIEEEGSMPTSLRFASGEFKHGSDPHRMYQTLTHGYGMMNPQRWMVPQQKYEVIHYIREHFLKRNNPSQLTELNDAYLASLPTGDSRGPRPIISRPWTQMDYGTSFINTIEVSRDGSNIAQKGIAIRLDDGPGGVESGKYWMMYEHDTMRLAGAWSGQFIDYEGIHFNGTHGRHPHVTGKIHFENPTAPGWGRPTDGSFKDNRLVGRDGKHYGPLDREWAQYKGMYRFGKQTIIKYTVGSTAALETPSLKFVDDQPVFQRNINLGKRDQDLMLQVAKFDSGEPVNINPNSIAIVSEDSKSRINKAGSNTGSKTIKLDGSTFGEIQNGRAFNLLKKDFTILARIKTTDGGTIFAITQSQQEWIPNGKTFFVRDGRLTYDIGWVGAVTSNRKIDDGQWHDVGMTWNAKSGQIKFFVDGKPSGGGELRPKGPLKQKVARIGFTNENFPAKPAFIGEIESVGFYQRALSNKEFSNPKSRTEENLIGLWMQSDNNAILESAGRSFGSKSLDAKILGVEDGVHQADSGNLLAHVAGINDAKWEWEQGNLRLRIPAGGPVNIVISHVPITSREQAAKFAEPLGVISKPRDLSTLTQGGPSNYPETLTSEIVRGDDSGPFAVDVFKRPTKNPWNAQLRLTGLDFLPDGDTMVVSAWDGSVWKVSGISKSDTLQWKRIAAGLFQPLGIRWIDGKAHVTCRDQLVVLHDLNNDGEADWYQSLNSDHQVTEHFHEFAMGLQTDDEGNFYYAKSARHAKTAIVPHHGTLLKISRDGQETEILANGFRAANGVCINPDGSFVVTDQEGHWNPKNRINWVKPGGFYGNMFGYHDVTDSSDAAMDQPLCWITNEFDRSPSELLWVESEKWGPLNGSLLNFSYGYGKVYIVPHENVNGQFQGGMCEFPLPKFPTGVMRGRFHPTDGQLYSCGMFAWAGSQHQPGGLYRIRYTGKPVHLPIGLKTKPEKIEIKLSGKVDPASANDPENYSIQTWDLKRTKNYGSKHYNERRLEILDAHLKEDGQTVVLMVPNLRPTWGMSINYSIRTSDQERLQGEIHNSIFALGPSK